MSLSNKPGLGQGASESELDRRFELAEKALWHIDEASSETVEAVAALMQLHVELELLRSIDDETWPGNRRLQAHLPHRRS